jgi:CheY-like chemotaxis protein
VVEQPVFRAHAPALRQVGAREGHVSSAHILAVDDDPSVRQMISDYLGDNEMRVTALPSARQIPDLLARESVDLVVLDVRLPGEDGMEVARRLREEFAGLPIIMLTGRKDEADRVMGLELGADDYLTKPFSPRELLARASGPCCAAAARSRAWPTACRRFARIASQASSSTCGCVASPRRAARTCRSPTPSSTCWRGSSRRPSVCSPRDQLLGPLAAAQRRGLRPVDRHARRAPAQEAGAAGLARGDHSHRARLRLRLHRRRRDRPLNAEQAVVGVSRRDGAVNDASACASVPASASHSGPT